MLNLDRLLATRRFVFGRNGEDTVGIDVESDFDLRDSPRCGWNSVQNEATDGLVVNGHGSFALQDMNLDRRLTIGSCREDFGALGRNGRVGVDEVRHDPAERFDSQRERRHIEQHDILHITGQHSALNRRADRNDFVGIHAAVRFLSEELAHELDHTRHSGRTADEDNLVDISVAHLGVGQRFLARYEAALNEIFGDLLKLRAGQVHVEVLRPFGGCRDEGQIYLCLRNTRELDLRFLAGFLQALERHRVFAQVDTLFFLKLVGDIIYQALIPIISAQVRIAVARLHLEDPVAE